MVEAASIKCGAVGGGGGGGGRGREGGHRPSLEFSFHSCLFVLVVFFLILIHKQQHLARHSCLLISTNSIPPVFF